MSATRPVHARDVFNDALERPPAERDVFVVAACGGDIGLKAEVHSLLHAHEEAQCALEPASTPIDHAAPVSRLVGARIGSYHIQRLVAAGGMGAVYEATQERPRRIVALKLLRQGIASRSALRRFKYETEILARLHHPGIAQIYEAGTHDDGTGAIPYFAMEYIPAASTLTEFARTGELTLRERLELFARVCDAVHHGHQKGIIHRDLKPSNILVDSAGIAKVIDFGVARATDSDLAVTTLQTDMGQLVGTVQYMSPEQCAADPQDIDTRSDVYSLGVVLYELLCENPPYDLSRMPLHEATRIIREYPLPRPSGINRVLRGDVETIVVKALEKERTRRYQSAGDLGEDIRRYLRNESILARPPSVIYQLRTFARRNRALVRGAAAFVMLLIAAVVTVSILLAVVERDRDAKRKIAEDAIRIFSNQVNGSVEHADRAFSKAFATTMIETARQNLEQSFADQPEILTHCLVALGDAYASIGDFTGAETQVNEALEIATRMLGREHPQAQEALGMLAKVYRCQTNHHRAEQVYLELIANARAQDYRNPAPLEALADMYLDLGRCADAEKLLLEAVGVLSQARYGPEGPVYWMTNLANVYRNQGRFDDADRTLHAALERLDRIPAVSGYDRARPRRELARLRLVQGRLDDARQIQQQAREGYRQQGAKPDILDVLICDELGGLIDLQEGDFAQAEQAFVYVADQAEHSFNSEKMWWAAHFRVGEARCLMLRHEYALADEILQKSYEELNARLGQQHHRTQNCIRALVDLHENLNDGQAGAWIAKLRPQGCL